MDFIYILFSVAGNKDMNKDVTWSGSISVPQVLRAHSSVVTNESLMSRLTIIVESSASKKVISNGIQK